VRNTKIGKKFQVRRVITRLAQAKIIKTGARFSSCTPYFPRLWLENWFLKQNLSVLQVKN